MKLRTAIWMMMLATGLVACTSEEKTVGFDTDRELIEVTKSDERVLIAGDLNCRDLSTLALFREAGINVSLQFACTLGHGVAHTGADRTGLFQMGEP